MRSSIPVNLMLVTCCVASLFVSGPGAYGAGSMALGMSPRLPGLDLVLSRASSNAQMGPFYEVSVRNTAKADLVEVSLRIGVQRITGIPATSVVRSTPWTVRVSSGKTQKLVGGFPQEWSNVVLADGQRYRASLYVSSAAFADGTRWSSGASLSRAEPRRGALQTTLLVSPCEGNAVRQGDFQCENNEMSDTDCDLGPDGSSCDLIECTGGWCPHEECVFVPSPSRDEPSKAGAVVAVTQWQPELKWNHGFEWIRATE